jgi:hypothetical protein
MEKSGDIPEIHTNHGDLERQRRGHFGNRRKSRNAAVLRSSQNNPFPPPPFLSEKSEKKRVDEGYGRPGG